MTIVEVPTSGLGTIFKQVPLLAVFRPEDFQIKSLPGFTNKNLHLKNDQHDWVLRIPKQDTNQYINRQHEAYNAKIASGLGIAPGFIWNGESGLALSVTLLNTRSINGNDMDDKSILINLLNSISRLHKSKHKFRGTVDLGELLPRYYQMVPKHLQSQIATAYKFALAKLESLSEIEKMTVPSHNDLVLENILINPEKQICIIDWEYASMASPYWDLATICNVANFNREQCVWLLDSYNSHNLNLENLFHYRYMLAVLSICWMAAFSEIDIGKGVEKLGFSGNFMG